jgi:hypothetical protein
VNNNKILGEPQHGPAQKRGGGRLNRTETVTIRLDPKLNYLCELASRVQRRTKSSFVESAIAERIDSQPLFPRNNDGRTLGDMAEQLWHVREHERLISLVEHAPHLMSYEEQQIWALIAEHSVFWLGRWHDRKDGTEEFQWTVGPSSLRRDQVAAHWNTLVKVADGSLPLSALPAVIRSRPKAEIKAEIIEDDIPF